MNLNTFNNNKYLKWARDIKHYIEVKKQFSLWGNVYDIYPIRIDQNDDVITVRLKKYLTCLFNDLNFNLIICYEPLIGISYLDGDKELFNNIYKKHSHEIIQDVSDDQDLTTIEIAYINIEKAIKCEEPFMEKKKIVCLIEWASFLPLINSDEDIINEFYYRMFRLCNDEVDHRIVWLLNEEYNLPDWYIIDNSNYKSIAIAKPDYSTRRLIIETESERIIDKEKSDENDFDSSKYIELFVNQTHNHYSIEIQLIFDICVSEGINFENIADVINRYKLGEIENPWSKLLGNFDKVKRTKEKLEERVIGQEIAVQKTTDVINRAYFNLSGSQFSKISQRPKGVLFFAGPTGVGKTELAKAITQHLFGSDTSFIRFDMTEFNHEHADHRLVGAPPGYIGHSAGGELTNKIKQQPFSVVLFDEIEKAHPRILDKFLQILDDGRLTSGKGETVYFSESLIIFTSNLGIENTKEEYNKPYEELINKVDIAIESFFKKELNRPELLNRIGKNLVIFDYIRKNAAEKIFLKMINNVLSKLYDDHRIHIDPLSPDKIDNLISMPEKDFTKEQEQNQILILLGPLMDECFRDLRMGGRGIGNSIEEHFINPLSSALLNNKAKNNDIFLINIDEKKCTLSLKRKE